MKKSFYLALVACGFLTIGSAVSAAAQTPAPAPDSQMQRAPAPIAGDLTNVDTEAKTLTVKIADGSEVMLKYTDATQVTGGRDGAAGLATLKDSKVTVHFTENAKDHSKTAARIIVQAAK
jgi:hypothetical protein